MNTFDGEPNLNTSFTISFTPSHTSCMLPFIHLQVSDKPCFNPFSKSAPQPYAYCHAYLNIFFISSHIPPSLLLVSDHFSSIPFFKLSIKVLPTCFISSSLLL